MMTMAEQWRTRTHKPWLVKQIRMTKRFKKEQRASVGIQSLITPILMKIFLRLIKESTITWKRSNVKMMRTLRAVQMTTIKSSKATQILEEAGCTPTRVKSTHRRFWMRGKQLRHKTPSSTPKEALSDRRTCGQMLPQNNQSQAEPITKQACKREQPIQHWKARV